MRYLLLLLPFVFMSCTPDEKTRENNTIEIEKPDENPALKELDKDSVLGSEKKSEDRTYSNQRFRDVKVERIADERFRISGEAQIFEANFGWVIEDGHNELAQGHEMTDAGAPEWGEFEFEVQAQKARENSTLHIILFEASAKDGSRQHELMIPLY